MAWGMALDDTFRTRLRTLKLHVAGGKTRAEKDAKAFELFRKYHPRAATDRRGDPFWDGSEAQQLLNLDIDNNKHKEMTPLQLYQSREEYRQWKLEVFRGHIHQEKDTRKYLHTLKLRAQEKAGERIAAFDRRQKQVERYEEFIEHQQEEE